MGSLICLTGTLHAAELLLQRFRRSGHMLDVQQPAEGLPPGDVHISTLWSGLRGRGITAVSVAEAALGGVWRRRRA